MNYQWMWEDLEFFLKKQIADTKDIASEKAEAYRLILGYMSIVEGKAAIEELKSPKDDQNLEAFDQLQKSERDFEMACPKCSENTAVTTIIEAAPQPDYVLITSHYKCQKCGYHNTDQVCLHRELALQEYNLEQLMKGV